MRKPSSLIALPLIALVGGLTAQASAAPRARRVAAAVKAPAPLPGESAVVPSPVTTPAPLPAPQPAPVRDEGYPPMLTDQQERELSARFRQELVRVYLPLLARPTVYKAVHDDPVPDNTPGWDHLRQPVKDKLVGRLDAVDARSRGRGALEGREIDRAYGERPDRRPEHLRALLLKAPRIDDVSVELKRVQPLSGEVTRLDFDVTLSCQGNQTVNSFRAVDVTTRDGRHLYPARLIQDARCGALPLNLDPGANLFSIDQWTQMLGSLLK